MQQATEMIKNGDEDKICEAIAHVRKFLSPASAKELAMKVTGLLAFARMGLEYVPPQYRVS